MEFHCPLCGQPVSKSVFDKITGIWKARQKALAEIKKQRVKLNKEFKLEKRKFAEKLAVERKKFAQQRTVAIQKAVSLKTRQYERQIGELKQKEQMIKEQAQRQIDRTAAKAHIEAERIAKSKFSEFKKEHRADIKKQLKLEREYIKHQTELKYKRLDMSFRNALRRMDVQSKTISAQKSEIQELKNQLERQTTPQLEGLLYEEQLAKELKKCFPDDYIQHTGKGGDVLQRVMQDKQQVGLIVYECKRVKHYSTQYVKQTAKAKNERNADFAILVTNAMKKGTQGFFVERNVIVVHVAGVLSVAGILRSQIVQIARMKLGQLQKDKAIKLVFDYLEGPEFANSMDSIIQESISVSKDLIDEVKKHMATWKKRRASYRAIYEEATIVKGKSKDLLSGKSVPKIQKTAFPVLVKLPEVEEPEQKVPIEIVVPIRKKKSVKVYNSSFT